MTLQNYVGKVELINDSAIPAGAFGNSTFSQNGYKEYSLFTQWRKSKTYNDGNYKIESYQQHEIYKDEKGNTVKIVPTDNYQYVRYCPGCEISGIPSK
ncbi:hypothetical protein [Paenibacillus contaminans]|uniref:hypothetical protein n=1 Tax=Paenibacillus contaminans TaxID=450362 RepID=UPI0011BF22F3|nr:hypothetical protein [Paenibacillus contaminans]